MAVFLANAGRRFLIDMSLAELRPWNRLLIFVPLYASGKLLYWRYLGSPCTLLFSAKNMKSVEFHHIRRTCGDRLEWLCWILREGNRF
jgi:hypothetical protein